jgi:hypothetical protein
MKINVTKEWCERSAEIEGDSEIGAGCPPPTCSPSSVRAFRVTETGCFDEPTVTVIRTTTPARAKHLVWDSAHSAGYLIEFKSLKVVRAPEYDTAKLKQHWCYSEDFARSILPENA